MLCFPQKFLPTQDKRKNCAQLCYVVPSVSTCIIRTNHETFFKSPGCARAPHSNSKFCDNYSVCEGLRENTPFLLRTVMLTLGEYCSLSLPLSSFCLLHLATKMLLANIQESLATRKQTRKVGGKFFSVFEARSAKFVIHILKTAR